ncbi:MAG: CHAT domain-containing protein, partial [Aureispira sp.]|nr:CHAT domain-containing protein [Aureispira sp.]
EDIHKESLEIRAKVYSKASPEYAVGLNNLGAFYRKVEQYEAALPLLKEALDIYQNLEKSTDYAFCYANLSGVYHALGKLDKATEMIEKAYELTKKIYSPNHPRTHRRMIGLASHYTSRGLYEKALKLYNQALGKDGHKGKFASYLAQLYLQMGDYKKSEAIYTNILQNLAPKVTGNPLNRTSIYNSVGDLYKQLNQSKKAKYYYNKSLETNAKLDSLSIELNESWQQQIISADFVSLSFSLKTLKKHLDILIQDNTTESSKQAYLISQTVLQLAKKFNKDFGADKDKLRILSKMGFWITKSIQFAMEFSIQEDKHTHYQAIFNYSEQNKSNLLADATKAQRARAMSDLPDSLAIKELVLQRELSSIKRKLTGERKEAKIKELQKQFSKLNIKISDFRKHIESNYPKYYHMKYEGSQVSVQEIQQQLPKATAFIEYYVAPQAIYLIYIDKDNLEVFPLEIDSDSLSTQVKMLRNVLTNYQFINAKKQKAFSLYSQSAFWCYQQLLQPALEGKELENLIIVADKDLGHIPFEVFLTKDLSRNQSENVDYGTLPYLLKDYTINYNYSAALWSEISTSKQQKNNGQMLAIAANYGIIENTTNRTKQQHSIRAALNELPAAKEEVKELAKFFNGNFWFDKDATEQNFKNNASKYGVIHLAMHGLLNKKRPILSSLAFTEDGDTLQDNFLEAWEIAHQQLNTDLVVLSACETGYGKIQQGEGVMSLARSFMYAGVPSLVVSLWQVNDQSTASIMQKFYKNLSNGQDKATALRQAKLDYIQQARGIAAHPAFWAPFIQLGDSHSISLSRKGNWTIGLWLGLGGVASILVLGLIFKIFMQKKELVS